MRIVKRKHRPIKSRKWTNPKDAQVMAHYDAAWITFNRRDHPASNLKAVFDYAKATPAERKAFFDAKQRHNP
jgi:hypothetical protein